MDGLREEGPERVVVEARLGFELTPGVAWLFPTRVLPGGGKEELPGIQYRGGSVARCIGRRYGTGEYELKVQDYESGTGSHFGLRRLLRKLVIVEGFGPPRSGGEGDGTEPFEEPAAPPPPGSAPPREASRMRPPMVQSYPENAAPQPSGMEALLLQVLAELRDSRRDESTTQMAQLVTTVQGLATAVQGLSSAMGERLERVETRIEGELAKRAQTGGGAVTLEQAFTEYERTSEQIQALVSRSRGKRDEDDEDDDERPRRNPEPSANPAEFLTQTIQTLAPVVMMLREWWTSEKKTREAELRQADAIAAAAAPAPMPAPEPEPEAPTAAAAPPQPAPPQPSRPNWVALRKAARARTRVTRPVPWSHAGTPAADAGAPGG